MEQREIYTDMALRTGGNIYIGVVGPVRTVAKAEAYVDKLLSPPAPVPAKKMPVYHIRDVRFFLNTIDRSVRLMQSAGVRATSRQDKKDGVLTLTVRIPMEENSPH